MSDIEGQAGSSDSLFIQRSLVGTHQGSGVGTVSDVGLGDPLPESSKRHFSVVVATPSPEGES